VWAYGTRNEVGITLDNKERLWGVENGIDNLYRPDLGNIAVNNPSEELNLFDSAGSFYGYPFCFSEYLLPQNISRGPGSQWVTQPFMDDGVHSDSWCEASAIRPKYNLPAHSSPLDLKFYYGDTWPIELKGDLFVSNHGTGLQQGGGIAGFDIVHIDFQNELPVSWESIVSWEHIGQSNMTVEEILAKWHRFVSVEIGPCVYSSDCLFTTSDNENGIYGGVLAVFWHEK